MRCISTLTGLIDIYLCFIPTSLFHAFVYQVLVFPLYFLPITHLTLYFLNPIVFKLGILVELDKSCAIYTVCNKPQIDISLTLHFKLSLLICLLQYLGALMQSRSNIYVVEKGSTLKILIGAIKYKFYNLSINAAAVGEQVGGCLVLSILSTSVLYCVDYNGYVLNGSVVAGTFS